LDVFASSAQWVPTKSNVTEASAESAKTKLPLEADAELERVHEPE
jgi:hypothetical protein